MELNPTQEKAVQHEKGPLLVVAGAGTGKTRVITERIRYLIQEKGVDPQHILALTFTEKAAGEMLSRVDEVMPLGYEEPWLSTFHSFADRILRSEVLAIGLDPSYKILTRPEQWLLVRKNLFKFDLDYYRPLGNPTKFISAMLTFFSRAQDEDVKPEEFMEFAKGTSNVAATLRVASSPKGRRGIASQLQEAEGTESERLMELANAYSTYQSLKIQESALDFGDLIIWCLKLFHQRPNILAKYQAQFEHILVDEFQDTNFAQYELIKLLAPAKQNPNLVVVGDDDQSIYKFRGASVANILSFKNDYPEAETVVLTQNYRSNQEILDAAYKLIRHNDPDRLEVRLGIEKKLTAARSPRRGVTSLDKLGTSCNAPTQALIAGSGDDEARQVVDQIEKLASTENRSWQDFAILARANNHLDPFVTELKARGIPYQLLGNRGLFDQEEVRDAIATLKVIADPSDSPSLYRLLIHPHSGLSAQNVVDLVTTARQKRQSLWEALSSSALLDQSSLLDLLKNLRQKLTKTPPSTILYEFLTQSGFIEHLIKEESIENQLRIKNLNLFLQKIKVFEAQTKGASLVEFLDYLEMLTEAGENPAQAEIEDIDTVRLLTVHSAKGLEFPIVFLVDLAAGRFPTRDRGEPIPFPDELIKETLPTGDYHLEEERRLFYVGLTRAMDKVYLSYAVNYGGTREVHPSGFIEETGVKPPTSKPEKSQLSLFLEESKTKPPTTHHLLPTTYSPSYISYSQLETFANCPLRYKYKHVLGIPTKESHVLNFGQTLHRTLRDYHRFDLFNKEPNLDKLLELYQTRWIDTGYDSPEHKETRKKQGEKILKTYFESYPKKLGTPLHVEKKFTLKIGGTDLIGSIDRIDKTKEGFEIIDYKTGSGKEQKEVDKDDQLTIYALAARDALKISPDILSLYFLEDDEKVQTKRTAGQLEEKKEEIVETIKEIKQSDFPPKPSMLCKFCDFKSLCPDAYKES